MPPTSFYRHMAEMTLSMVVPFGVFFVLVRIALPAAGLSLPFLAVALSGIAVMVVPMTALMLYRRQSVRDIVEMNLAMFAGMLTLMPLSRVLFLAAGIALGLEQFLVLALVAMTAPMIVLMYVRRQHHTNHSHRARP
jgi:hypothetical protein